MALYKSEKTYQWTQLASGSALNGALTINLLPYSEVYVYIDWNNGLYAGSVIPKAVIGSSLKNFNIAGYYGSSDTNFLVNVGISNTQAKVNTCYINGTNRTSDIALSLAIYGKK